MDSWWLLDINHEKLNGFTVRCTGDKTDGIVMQGNRAQLIGPVA